VTIGNVVRRSVVNKPQTLDLVLARLGFERPCLLDRPGRSRASWPVAEGQATTSVMLAADLGIGSAVHRLAPGARAAAPELPEDRLCPWLITLGVPVTRSLTLTTMALSQV
jgi:hypothetical protein